MAQVLLDCQLVKNAESVKSYEKSVTNSSTAVNKGTLSILRKLRYRTGKLNTK